MVKMLAAVLLALPLLLAACGGDNGDDPRPSRTATNESGSRPTATSAQIADLAKVAVPGYSAETRGDTLLGAAVTYLSAKKTAGGADLMVRATFAACDEFVCTSLNPSTYKDATVQDSLKSVLPSVHKENPDLRWEFGEADLSPKAKGLYYYALSFVEEKGNDGSVSRSSANSYRAWYHNGSAYVTLEVFSRSPVSSLSLADLEKTMTKAEAEQAAKDVFAALEPKLP
jgi:hypothetical protein